MDSDPESSTSSRIDKGKQRALEPTETTPLLAQTSHQGTEENEQSSSLSTQRSLLSTLLRVFLISLTICIIILVIMALLTWSYVSRTSNKSPDTILHEAVVFEGPRRVNVLNTTWSDGLWVTVEGKVGVNAGTVVGVNTDPYGDGFFENLWKAVGRWGIHELHQVSLRTSTINIVSVHDPSTVLASLDIPPLEVPLASNPPHDNSWLKSISTPVLIRPTQNTTALMEFVRESWRVGFINVKAELSALDVQGGSLTSPSWRSMLHKAFSDVKTSIRVQIPSLPGLPHPGRNAPFPSVADLVTLRTFNLFSSDSKLHIGAVATVVDPAPHDFDLEAPSLPFIISLPSNLSSSSPIASVDTESFSLTHPNITLNISGHVLPLREETLPLLSAFVSRYLSGRANPITIATPLIPNLSADVQFPGPAVKPQILRNVTIRDMKIKPGNTWAASGTVFARVVLPKGMNVEVDVRRVLPDVLVFDGEVPDSQSLQLISVSSFEPPPRRPLPDPLPEKAFGHLRPDDWLVSSCEELDPEAGEGTEFAVEAQIVDVPLEVLPGRHAEFSDFVSKVIFGRQGAVAGILGTADVGVMVNGLPVEPDHAEGMVLSGLPFKGSVRVGGKKLLVGDEWQ